MLTLGGGASSAQNATRWNGQNYVQQKETTEKLNNAQNQDEVIEALAKASEQSKQNIGNRENGNIELYEFTESIIPEYAEALNNVTRHENGVGEHYNVDETIGLDKNLDNLANGTFFYPYYGGKILKDVFEGGVMLVAGTIVGNVYGVGKAGMFLLQNGIGQGVEYLRDKNANNPNIDTHFKINLASDGIGYGLDKFQIYDTTTEKYNMISPHWGNSIKTI